LIAEIREPKVEKQERERDWVQKIAMAPMEFGISMLSSEKARLLGHVQDIGLVRDKYYLTKAYVKVGILRINEYWDVMKKKWKAAQDLSTHASTSIEGNPLPLTEVKAVLKGRPKRARDSEREVMNYNQILIWLDNEIGKGKLKINLQLILKIQKQVVSDLLPRYDCGVLRKRQVVVNDPRTGQMAFIPPNCNDVPRLMKELIGFVDKSRGEIDPVILAGLFHKQMVLIHPFIDGNGRSTRLTTKVLLSDLGLDIFNLFSFENYYNQNVTKYFATVGEYGDYYELKSKIDFTNWLEYFTEGIIDELLRVQKLLDVLVKNDNMEPYHQCILDYLSAHGRISDKEYAKLTKRADSTRILDFKYLLELGLIKRRGAGPATYYVLENE